MKLLCSKMEKQELIDLLKQLDTDFEIPNLKSHFPAIDQAQEEEGDIEPVQKESHKRAMI